MTNDCVYHYYQMKKIVKKHQAPSVRDVEAAEKKIKYLCALKKLALVLYVLLSPI